MSAAWEVRNRHADLMHVCILHSSTAFRNVLLPATPYARYTEGITGLPRVLFGNIGWLLPAIAKRILFQYSIAGLL